MVFLLYGYDTMAWVVDFLDDKDLRIDCVPDDLSRLPSL